MGDFRLTFHPGKNEDGSEIKVPDETFRTSSMAIDRIVELYKTNSNIISPDSRSMGDLLSMQVDHPVGERPDPRQWLQLEMIVSFVHTISSLTSIGGKQLSDAEVDDIKSKFTSINDVAEAQTDGLSKR